MVTQLQIAFDREKMILSPYDEVLHKQLIDYEVIKTAANGDPIFTSVNEHFVDALGLAFLAFVLEFPDLTKIIKKSEPEPFKMSVTNKRIGDTRYKNLWNSISSSMTGNVQKSFTSDDDDLPGDKPTLFEVPYSYNFRTGGVGKQGTNWGSRGSTRKSSRSTW